MKSYVIVDIIKYPKIIEQLDAFCVEYQMLFDGLKNESILSNSPIVFNYFENFHLIDCVVVYSNLNLNDFCISFLERCFLFDYSENLMCKLYDPFTLYSLIFILDFNQKKVIFSKFKYVFVSFKGEFRFFKNQFEGDLFKLSINDFQFNLIFEARLNLLKINIYEKYSYQYKYDIIADLVEYAVDCDISDFIKIQEFVDCGLRFDLTYIKQNLGEVLEDKYTPDSIKILEIKNLG